MMIFPKRKRCKNIKLKLTYGNYACLYTTVQTYPVIISKRLTIELKA